ncbi:MAG: DUF1326 domain-containing protein [Deltaproteobacteria bacterium]|nr:DUF1326 domain-containing protein [Deltaproteobacteria bacterium]
MAWSITAQMIETCSCNMLCPCWFGVRELMVMDQGWCASAIVFRIQQGNADGVNLGGCTVVFAVDFPGPTLFDGNGTARLYIDEAANAEQRRELEAIFQGKKGGPWEVVSGLITKWLPTQAPKIEIQEEGDTLIAIVGSVGQVKSQRLKDAQGQPTTMQNTGFTTAWGIGTAELAPSGSQWSDPDLRRFGTKSGVRGAFNWSA